MTTKPTVLVLCTGNSCRGQIAEGYLRHSAGNRFNALSAGTEPRDEVHPLAVEVMREDGIDISDQRPKHVKPRLAKVAARYVIIVCSGANESCPRIFPGVLQRLYWPFDDPAGFDGPDAIVEFRRVRDEIKQQILSWLETV